MANLVEQVDLLRANHPDWTWDDLAEYLNKGTGQALRGLYRRRVENPSLMEDEAEEELEELTPEEEFMQFFHQKAEIPAWRDLAKQAKLVADSRKRADPHIKDTKVHIKTRKPIGVVFSGDWHLGDASVTYDKWLKDIQMVIDHPQMVLADMGDDRQNMRSFKDLSGVLGQVLSPNEQAWLMRGLVEELTAKNKLLCKVDGNHDVEFDERIFGNAIQSYLLEKMQAPRFRNKGLLFLSVGQEEYSILVFHKTRFRSIFRAAHGAYREWQFSYPADIVAGAHDHTPAFEMLPNYYMARQAGDNLGGLTFLIKTGTYQNDKYGWKYFHNGGAPECITVVLWPDEHRMQCFLSIQDAARFLDTF